MTALFHFLTFQYLKASIIGRIDKNVEGGWGVMGDDLVAGIAAGVAASATYQGLIYFSII
ncbi:MAG: phosphatidylglycerophosphatase A [Arcobacteraceae bacterium]|nr:phosphatidylglycerophosphatase A [Arcobacteraceae bacterium]